MYLPDEGTQFSYRKCQDNVYVKWEYWSIMQKIKDYLRHENKVIENKVLSVTWYVLRTVVSLVYTYSYGYVPFV